MDIFRGHANSKWTIGPSISRLPNPGNSGAISHVDWAGVEGYLIERFQQYSAPYLDVVPKSKIEWLVQCQHYGVPTSLVDWTTNPLKALYFAVEDPSFDKASGAVYLCTPNEFYHTTENIDVIDRIICFHSAHINPRLIAQEGCFVAFPLPKHFENFLTFNKRTNYSTSDVELLEKITIPKTFKPQIRMELSRLGITHKALFPGLAGIATSLVREFR